MLLHFVGNCCFVFFCFANIAAAIFHVATHTNIHNIQNCLSTIKKNDHSLWTVIGFILLVRKWLGCSNFNFIRHVHRSTLQLCLVVVFFFRVCVFNASSNRTWSKQLTNRIKTERSENRVWSIETFTCNWMSKQPSPFIDD